MTTPRSSASRATAGVGSTPPSTATPPASTTPRANASSSSTPDARVSRPIKTRPLLDQRVAALASVSTSSTVRSSPTTPRTPSVPKKRLAMAVSTCGSPAIETGTSFRPRGEGGLEQRQPTKQAHSRSFRAPPAAGLLALGELRRLACLVQAGFLALDDASIAGQVTGALERNTQLGIGLDQRAGDAVPERARLAAPAATANTHAQVVAPLHASQRELRHGRLPMGGTGEVVLDRTAVDPGLAVAGTEDHARHGSLALASSTVLKRLLCH